MRILGYLLLVLLLCVGCSDGDEVKAEVQQLFDTWNQALQEEDAELFRSILTGELAESCELDELQAWMDQDENVLSQFMVRSVFVDVADSSRAFAEVATMRDAGMPEEAPTFPWPVKLEDGEWRAGFHHALVLEGCPYTASTEPSETGSGEREYPLIPGLDFERREDVLAAVPGTRVVHGSFRTDTLASSFSSSGPGVGSDQQIIIYAELKSDLGSGELVRLYRDGLKQPSWDILDEGSSGDYGWFSWNVADGDRRPWHGRLVIAPSREGWNHVWLALDSANLDDGQ